MFDGVGFGRSLLLMVGIGLGMPLGVRLDCDLQPFGRARPRVLLHPRPESRVVDVQSALLYMKGMVHLVEPACDVQPLCLGDVHALWAGRRDTSIHQVTNASFDGGIVTVDLLPFGLPVAGYTAYGLRVCRRIAPTFLDLVQVLVFLLGEVFPYLALLGRAEG